MIKTIGSDTARLNFRDVLDEVYREKSEFVVERYSKPVAVVVGYEQWQALKELQKAALLAEAKDNLARSLANGTMTTHDELKRLMVEKAGHVDA